MRTVKMVIFMLLIQAVMTGYFAYRFVRAMPGVDLNTFNIVTGLFYQCTAILVFILAVLFA